MDDKELKKFIHDNKSLFWYTPEEKLDGIDHEAIVETILNYGNWESVLKLFDLMGIKKVAEIFFKSINSGDRRRNNYNELTINYFTIVFNRYAS